MPDAPKTGIGAMFYIVDTVGPLIFFAFAGFLGIVSTRLGRVIVG